MSLRNLHRLDGGVCRECDKRVQKEVTFEVVRWIGGVVRVDG